MTKKYLDKKNRKCLRKNNFLIGLNESLSKKEKIILMFQGFFIVCFLFFIFIFSAPKALSPISGMSIMQDDFIFKIKNAEKVIISNNIDFENSLIINPDSYLTLAPGKYYWKVKNDLRESEVKSFIINEVVGLELSESEGVYELRNSGNVILNIKEKNNTKNYSDFILGIGEIVSVNNSVYEGGKND